MTLSSVSDWDATTAANNIDVGGVGIQGSSSLASGDNAIRELMRQVGAYTRRGTDLASASTLNLDSIDTLLLNVTGTTTVTAVTLTSGHWRIVRATGILPFTASSSLIINGSSSVSYTAVAGDLLLFEGYGSSVVRMWVIGAKRGYFATPVATSSGTAIDFTSLPAGIKRIVVHFAAVSTNGTSIPMLQIGDSGGLENSSYSGQALTLTSAPAITFSGFSTGFHLAGGWAATAQLLGFVTIERYMNNQHTWLVSGVIGRADANNTHLVAGSKTLSAELDRLTLTTVGGTDAFDAGAVQVTYELF